MAVEPRFQLPERAGWLVELSMTPADADHGAAEPVSKPGLPSRWPEQPPPPPLMVKVNAVLPPPLPPLPVAVAVTLYVPAVVGVPETVPVDEPKVTPGGSPVADQVYGAVPPERSGCRPAIGRCRVNGRGKLIFVQCTDMRMPSEG